MITSITYLLLLIVLGVLLPLNGILSGRRIKEIISEYPQGRLLFYKQTVIVQIVLSVLVVAAIFFNQDSIDVIGFSFFKSPFQFLGLLGCCLLGWWLLLLYPFDQTKLRLAIERDKAVKFLLPSTEEEYRWSIAVSFAAGICEEILFRGFLYWQLVQWLPVISAILITNLIFGLCHFATGLKNAFLAFGLGVLLSILFLYTESLWWLMLIHVLIDIYSMTKGKRFFEQNKEVE